MSELFSMAHLRQAIDQCRNIPEREGDYICICHPSVIYGKNWRRKLREQSRRRRAWLRYYCREAHRMRHLKDTSDTTERILGWAGANGYFRRGKVPKMDYPELKKFEGSGL